MRTVTPIWITYAIYAAIVLAAIFGQIFLSRARNKLLGLILPTLSLIVAVITSLIVGLRLVTPSFTSVLLPFLLCNIPTAVLLLIYAVCRAHIRRRRDIDAMSAQDLE
ncbi:MAG: hypothetical protein LBN02_08785 [Oscillospiraceae bacterium]|nr:hypothetical protein [Oscillospiraceae bacterium]